MVLKQATKFQFWMNPESNQVKPLQSMLCTNNNRCKLTAITLGRESDALPPCPTSFQHHNLEMSIIIIIAIVIVINIFIYFLSTS